MSYLLFVDECGHDHREAPYEVLAGICVEDKNVWNLIDALNSAEERILGIRYSRVKEEVKGKKFLKKKVFRHANQLPPLVPEERRLLARELIEDGVAITQKRVTA